MIPKEHEFAARIEYRPIVRTSEQDRRVTRADLSKDQHEALDHTLALLNGEEVPERDPEFESHWSHHTPIIALGGYAGTGKSTLVPIISEALGDTEHTAFVAFTGKASNVLQRKLQAAGVQDPGYVGTIHRLIYKPLTDNLGRIVGWKRKSKPLFVERDDGGPAVRIKRIIIDEASMVGIRILEDLLDYHVPILAVGDPGQLPPIHDVSVINSPDVILQEIHRQAADNPIIQLANEIRHTHNIPTSLLKGHVSDPRIKIVTRRDSFEVVGESYERLGLNMSVLVRTNRVRKNFNIAPRTHKPPLVGDIVICLKNNPPIYNGMRGIIEKIEPFGEHWYQAKIVFPDDGLAVESLLNRYQFGRDYTIETAYDLQNEGIDYPNISSLGLLFDFGIALTVHKAQGSAFEEVILCPDRWSKDLPEDYGRWLYTAVTRASDRLIIVN